MTGHATIVFTAMENQLALAETKKELLILKTVLADFGKKIQEIGGRIINILNRSGIIKNKEHTIGRL